MLEANHQIVSVADNDDFSARYFLAPYLDPQIEDIMQIHIGQKGRYYASYTKDNFEFERTVGYRR